MRCANDGRVEEGSLEVRFCERYGLSPREQDVFLLLVRGRTAQVISDKLFISVETVRVHIKNIYRKAGVHSQQELIDRFEGDSDGADRPSSAQRLG